MKTLEKGQDKIQKICSVLREETLEPAQKEAEKIISEAKKQAEQILYEAQKSAQQMHENAKKSIEHEHNAFQSSLVQAARQSLETLRHDVEEKFFNANLLSVIEKGAADPQLVANLINVIVKTLEKEGLAADLTALIPKSITPGQVNALLLKEVLISLQKHSVEIGKFAGGACVKLNNKKLTLDVTGEALKELLATYVVRKDFRKTVFES